MTAPVFVDSNVLVYGRDAGEPEKGPAAMEWLGRLWESRRGRLSFQVLAEYYVTVTRKLVPGLDEGSARADVRNLMAWIPLRVDGPVVEGAWALEDRHSLSWWDALVVSAAQMAGCGYLLSDDLQDGQAFDGVTVVDPFLHAPQDIL
jgi:predicted nucleic acid-binding protein